MIFSETHESKADGQHACVAQQCDCIERVLEVWGGFFGEALVHEFGEILGAEDVAAVDGHDGSWVVEVEVEVGLMVRVKEGGINIWI